jgi:dihydrofolate synthase/folylpolyglutamate synthase
VRDARIAARLQRLPIAGQAEVIVDVAHNPQAARVLAQWLAANPVAGRTFAVFGALDDKDVAGIIAPLQAQVDVWLLAALDRLSPRGLAATPLQARVQAAAPTIAVSSGNDPRAALAAARSQARPGDRIVAFGSFYVAAEVLGALDVVG